MSKRQTITLVNVSVLAALACLITMIFLLGRFVFYGMMIGVWLSAELSRYRFWLGACLSTVAFAAIVWPIIVFYRRRPHHYGD